MEYLAWTSKGKSFTHQRLAVIFIKPPLNLEDMREAYREKIIRFCMAKQIELRNILGRKSLE